MKYDIVQIPASIPYGGTDPRSPIVNDLRVDPPRTMVGVMFTFTLRLQATLYEKPCRVKSHDLAGQFTFPLLDIALPSHCLCQMSCVPAVTSAAREFT